MEGGTKHYNSVMRWSLSKWLCFGRETAPLEGLKIKILLSGKGNLERGRAKMGSEEGVDDLENFFQLFIYTSNTIRLGLRKGCLE